jgi:hypothetical protein
VIQRELVNVNDLEVRRPTRAGPGGDVKSVQTLHSGLRAIHEPRHRWIRTVDGREISIVATFYLDPWDSSGTPIDVKPGDFLRFTDYRTERTRDLEVAHVAPWIHGGSEDHLEVGIGR